MIPPITTIIEKCHICNCSDCITIFDLDSQKPICIRCMTLADSIEIKRIEDLETIDNLEEGIMSVIITLPNWQIEKLHKLALNRFGDPKYINGLIESQLLNLFHEKPQPPLTYHGKTKIRMDVLKKMRGISELMRTYDTYPKLKRQHLNKILKTILGDGDSRVRDSFIESVNRCVFFVTGKKPSLYDLVDCSSFVEAVDQKMQDLDR